jgi:hypothetical protein
MKKTRLTKGIIPGIIIWLSIVTYQASAQDSSKIFFTTAIGLIDAQGKFGNAFKSSIAFNSGIEITYKKDWYAQLVLDFNALKYDQQFRDAESPLLFQNTNSSLLLIGLNAGRNIQLKSPKWFTSVYAGGGYMNLGEPRVIVDAVTDVAKQESIRENNIFGRVGSRIGYRTKSKFFQTLYIDGSYFFSPAKIQGGKVNGISLFLGTRFGVL